MLDSTLIRYVTDPTEAARRAAQLAAEPVLGVDIETYPATAYRDRPRAALDPQTAEIRLLQVAALDGRVALFDLQQVPLDALAPLSAAPWATFNGSFEYRHLTHAGLTVPRLHDGMLLDRLLSHRLRKLADVSADVLGLDMDKTEQVSDWGTAELSEHQLHYAALDALATVRIARELLPKVERNGQRRLYALWCDVLPVLAGLQLRGQCFDWAGHAELQIAWQQERDRLQGELREHLGPEVSPNSGPQLGTWLQQRLDADTVKRWPKTEKTGRLKTDADSLALFAHLPMVQPLLRYKAVSKLLSTYGSSYCKHRHPVTDQLHPEFSLGFTRSGRAVASKPNTQQAPKQGTFRELFTAPPGKVLVSADYSQIELVVAALLSGDRAMLDVYRKGGDLHRSTAAAIAGVDPEQVTPQQRQAAKPVNFGNLFGQGPAGLARTAQVDYGVAMSNSDAKQALLRFRLAYPQLEQWKRQQVAQAQQFRQVRTKLGLVRDFDAQGEGYLRGEAQNIPVQGSAAEVLMSALRRLPQALTGLDAALYHTVHDEITLQVPLDHAETAAEALQDAMVQGFLDVFPEAAEVVAVPEVKQGASWAAVH
ncbi:MAG: hypothetical protein K9L65_03020 [Chromatiaceae bacterium]|nr:hypothetical protein [Chromatiaceae bacterium]